MIKVIKHFFDLQDGNFEYKVGDVYPRNGYTATDVRISELAGKNNKAGEALIQVEKPKEETKPKKKKIVD